MSSPWKLFPPRRHLQPEAARPRQRTGALPLARLQTQQPQRHHEARRGRVHPPLPGPRPARRLRQDPPLRTARHPQPTSGPRPVQVPSPRHHPGRQHTADRTAEARTQPSLSPVQTRHPARGRKTATRWNGHLPRIVRLRALRLLLRKTLLTRKPTRSVASTGVHPANATPWSESVPHNLHPCRILPMPPQVHLSTVPRGLLTSRSVPNRPHRLTPNSIQCHTLTALGLLQIAVSAPLRIDSLGATKVLAAEHCRYCTRDLSLI